MFKLAASDDFTWTVEIPVPTDRGTRTRKMDVVFRTLPQDDVIVMMTDAQRWVTDRAIARGMSIAESDEGAGEKTPPKADPLLRIVVGWPSGAVQDAEGNALDFSPETAERLLLIPYVRTAVLAAYNQAMFGGAKTKN